MKVSAPMLAAIVGIGALGVYLGMRRPAGAPPAAGSSVGGGSPTSGARNVTPEREQRAPTRRQAITAGLLGGLGGALQGVVQSGALGTGA